MYARVCDPLTVWINGEGMSLHGMVMSCHSWREYSMSALRFGFDFRNTCVGSEEPYRCTLNGMSILILREVGRRIRTGTKTKLSESRNRSCSVRIWEQQVLDEVGGKAKKKPPLPPFLQEETWSFSPYLSSKRATLPCRRSANVSTVHYHTVPQHLQVATEIIRF